MQKIKKINENSKNKIKKIPENNQKKSFQKSRKNAPKT